MVVLHAAEVHEAGEELEPVIVSLYPRFDPEPKVAVIRHCALLLAGVCGTPLLSIQNGVVSEVSGDDAPDNMPDVAAACRKSSTCPCSNCRAWACSSASRTARVLRFATTNAPVNNTDTTATAMTTSTMVSPACRRNGCFIVISLIVAIRL